MLYMEALDKFFTFCGAIPISDADVARTIGVTPSAISHWRRRKGTPSFEARVAIERWTRGVISVSDWMLEITRELVDSIEPIGTPELKRVAAAFRRAQAAAAAQAPAKRGPGRPRKVVAAEPPPAKRGPGRPRKLAQPCGPGIACELEPPARRGPGRPRKAVSAELPVKRGPGRPRKAQVGAPATPAAPAKRGPGRPRKVLTVAPATPAAPAKRGPGRPRKVLAEAPAPVKRVVVVEKVLEEATSGAAPAKRGPGRPRKVVAFDTSAQSPAPEKRRPGRPRKVVASAAPVAPASGEVATADNLLQNTAE